MFALTDWKAGFHLFGHSDRQQWSADGSMLLGLRTMLSPRDLAIDSRAEIGMIPFTEGATSRSESLTECSLGCWIACPQINQSAQLLCKLPSLQPP